MLGKLTIYLFTSEKQKSIHDQVYKEFNVN